jgi:uncharacterized protein YbaP (TraB family)
MTLNPFFRLFLFLVSFTFNGVSLLFGQEAKSFLYRITGNNLTSPSFLYGTIHLQDSRLFNFQDSLYSYLEQSSIFAMELNPDSITQVFLNKEFEKGEKILIKDRMTKKSFNNLKKKYQHMSSEPIESLKLGELLQSVRAYNLRFDEVDKMPTFMDMYLMGMANNQGKIIEGLERVEDQMNLFESLLEGKDPELVLKGVYDKRKEGELLVKSYINTDMQAVANMISMMPPEIETLVLTNRNLVMLDGMEKLMKKGSLFTAVGVAHLPGKDGLIQLLRNKGYTVTPELSTTRTHAKQYRNPVKSGLASWKTIISEKDGYSVLMPGNPAKNAIEHSGSDIYTYINWETNEFYFSFHNEISIQVSEENRDSLRKVLIGKTVENMKGQIISPIKPTMKNGLNGYEVTSSGKENQFFKTVLLYKGDEIFILMKGAQNEESLANEDSERFFGSIKIIPKKMAKMEIFNDSILGFSILLPGTPTKNLSTEEGGVANKVQYLAKRGNTEFIVIVSSCNPGFQYGDDTLTIGILRRNLIEKMDSGFYEKTAFFQGRLPSWDLSGYSKDRTGLNFKFIQRGNRQYYLWIYAPESVDIKSLSEEYFNSFKLLPYVEPEFTLLQRDSILFSTTTGDIKYAENNGETDSSSIYVYHKGIASSMIFSYAEIGSMEWAASDSVYLRNYIVKANLIANEDILSENYLNHDGLPAFEMVLKRKISHQVSKQRVIKKGNTLYALSMDMEPEVVNLPSVQRMFNDVKINKQHPPLVLESNSAEKVFAMLDTATEETFRSIVYNFDDLPFTRDNLTLLLNKGSKVLAGDTLGYPSLESAIWEQVENVADSSDVPLLVQTWNDIQPDTNSSARSLLLNQLAQIGTKDAIRSLKKLFYPDYEKDPRIGLIFSTLSRNANTVEVVFPDWYSLVSDERYGYAILHLLNIARDSSFTIQEPPAGFEDTVINLGRSWLKNDKDKYTSYQMDLIKTLENFKSTKANQLLNELATTEDVGEYFRYEALLALLRNGEEPKNAIEQIASLPYWRNSLLETMEELEKPRLFPEKYKTQAYMAEAYLYGSLDDETPDEIEPIGTRLAKFNGKTYLFYVYRLGYTWEGETEYYLGISGPFDPVEKSYKLAIDDMWISGVASEPYDKKMIDKQLALYLQAFEAFPEAEDINE